MSAELAAFPLQHASEDGPFLSGPYLEKLAVVLAYAVRVVDDVGDLKSFAGIGARARRHENIRVRLSRLPSSMSLNQ